MGAFDELMAEVARLVTSAEALAALGARLRADAERGSCSILRWRTRSIGLCRSCTWTSESTIESELSLRCTRAPFLRQAPDLLEDPGRAPGWGYEDRVILLSLGRASASIAAVTTTIAPTFDGLDAALARADAVLGDVGAGVGGRSPRPPHPHE